MKTIKVSEATNTQLDWLVAKCEKVQLLDPYDNKWEFCWTLIGDNTGNYYSPTTDPAYMWPIIEREGISTVSQGDAHEWVASLWDYNTQDWHMHKLGQSALIAAARCYVVSKMGEEVEVPEELT